MTTTEKPIRATAYLLNLHGEVFKLEGRYHSFHESSREFSLRWIDPGKRKTTGYPRDKGDCYMLVLAGTGHPDAPPTKVPWNIIGDMSHSARRDPSLLDGWEAAIDAYIRRHDVRVLVDHRELVGKPAGAGGGGT